MNIFEILKTEKAPLGRFETKILEEISQALSRQDYGKAKVYLMGVYPHTRGNSIRKRQKEFLLDLLEAVKKEFRSGYIKLNDGYLFIPSYIFQNLNSILRYYK